MKDINYYTEVSTTHKNINYFVIVLEEELETFIGTVKELDEKRNEIINRAKIMFIENKKKRWDEKNVKLNEFKNDIAVENGIENHPKLNILWNKAWEHGHSSGLGEVQYYFEDLMELIL